MAEPEETRTGGEDGEGQETRMRAGELTSEDKDTEQHGQRRHDGGNRGVTIRDVAGGHGRQRDAPEEERRLVELRLIAHSAGEREPVAKRVLREEGLARLVGNSDRAAAHRHGADDCRCAQQRHEQHALPSRQPSRDVNRHADISHPRGTWSGSSSLDVVATTVPSDVHASPHWGGSESWCPYWHRGWILARTKGPFPFSFISREAATSSGSGVLATPSPSLAPMK